MSAFDTGTQSTSRWLRIFDNQLFSGSDEAPPYMFTVGPLGGPLLTTGPQSASAASILPGGIANPVAPNEVSSSWEPSPYGFLLFDLVSPPGPDTMYIADDGINPNGKGESGKGGIETGGGGLSKWTYDSATGWTQIWNVTAGTWGADAGALYAGSPIGYRGLAGFATGANVTLMATTADIQGMQDSLAVVINDSASSTTPPTPMVVASTPPNQVFRGVALTPQ
jgi:hypothetical protein